MSDLTTLSDAEYKHFKRLPVQIEGTLAKLERLFGEAQAYGLPADPEWRARTDELRSRFLTDPGMINAAWEQEVSRARKQGEKP